MASPQDYLRDPEWHKKPIEQREKELVAADPKEFGQFDPAKRIRIIKGAEKRYSQKSNVGQKPSESFRERIGADLSIGWQQGKAGVERSLANVADIVQAKGAAKSLRESAAEAEPPPGVSSQRQSVLDQVVQGIGAAPATIAKYAPAEMAGKYAPLAAGVIGAVSNLDKGPQGAIKEGLKDAVMFGAMGKASKLPTRATRALGGAAVAGGTTALFEGGDPKQIASAAIMGGGFGALGGKKTEMEAMTPEKARTLLEGGVGSVASARDSIRKVIAPQNRGPEARQMAHIIRANISDINRQSDIANYALQEAQKTFRLMPDEQRLSVIHAIEKGDPQSDVKFKTFFGEKTVEGKKMQEFVDTMRKLHNDVRDELINEASILDPKTGERKPTALKSVANALRNPDAAMKSYYLNYFPHLFTDPEAAAKRMQSYYAGRRPLEGPATFLKERKHPTIEDALWTTDENGQKISTGLKLVTTDPVEAYMLKWREMKRFTAAQKIMKDMAGSGLIQWVPPGRKGPVGWVQVRGDGAGKAFQRMKKSKGGSLDVVGNAWAPEPAARVLNNYLSPGLRQHAPVRAMLTFNNVLNQAQLGMSAFHLGFTAVDSVTSRFALGLEQMFEGGIKHPDPKMLGKGVSNVVKAAAFPVAIAENMRLGYKMRQEWRNPGSSGSPEIANLVSMMQESGGGMSLDPIYRTNMTQRLTEAIRQQNGFIKTAWRIPFAINEKVANLIMDKFVPMQKMGVFADLARFELERLPEGAPQAQVREVMAKAWDSVDNRMGMLRYDNLFWDKTVKDLAMLTTRSVGWNLGTLREIGGGMMDLSKMKNREFSHRLAYTVSLPVVTGLLGGLIHYAYNGKPPDQPMDYFFPRTGRRDEFNRDERISVPSYMKDLYHMYTGTSDIYHGLGPKNLLKTFGNKMHPSFSLISDILANRDFYNTEIANSNDPMIKRAMDTAKFVGTQAIPFSWQNISRERKLGFPISEQIGTAVGFIPAPADIKKTSAERLATDIMAERLPKRSSTREEKEHQVRMRELERRIRTQDDWRPVAQQALDEGALSESDILHAVDRASGLPLDRTFDRMTLEDAMRVYRVANNEEKGRLKAIFASKVERNADRISALPAEKRKRLANEILEIMNEKVPEPPPGR